MPKTGKKAKRSGEYKCTNHGGTVRVYKKFRFPKCKKCGHTKWVLVAPIHDK